MKWSQFINNYQKSASGEPMMKQFVLQSCLFMYYLGILIWWQTKGLIFLMNVLPEVYICSFRKKIAPLLRERTAKCTHLTANSHRTLTEINKSSAIVKILGGKWYFQTLKTFIIISSKMKISLLILSWWYFSCLHIKRIVFTFIWA